MREHFRGGAGIDGRVGAACQRSRAGGSRAEPAGRRAALLVLATLLACATEAQAQWTASVNDGRSVVVAPGGSVEVVFAFTRAPGEPTSAIGASVTGVGLAQQFLDFEYGFTGRCGFFNLDFLEPPGLLSLVSVSGVSAGETVRCIVPLYAAPDAAPGRYDLRLQSSAFSNAFFVDIGPAVARPIPVLEPAALAGLALAFGLLAAARLRPR